MAFTPFRPRKLATALATGAVSPKDQALYLVMSFVVWMIPSYLFIVPPITTSEWFYWLNAYEAFTVLVVNFAGVFFCLNRCTVDPGRHFLIDFSCLYGPVSLYVLAIAWGAFYAVTLGIANALSGLTFDTEPPRWLIVLYSSKAYDLMRYVTFVAVVAATFLRVGYYLNRIAEQRSDG